MLTIKTLAGSKMNSQVGGNSQIIADLCLKMLMNREDEATRRATVSRFTNRRYLLLKHELMLAKPQLFRYINSQINTYRPNEGRNYPVEIVDLNVVNVDDLISAVDQHLTGKFFLCRVLAPWMKIDAIVTIVEDVKGEKAIRLAIYNAPTVLKTKLHVGSIVAVKNPWFTRIHDTGFSLRVDNPADIIYDMLILGKLNVEWKGQIPLKYQSLNSLSKEEWKQLGNAFFIKKNYDEARCYYSRGLEEYPGDVDFLSNRAATFLHLRCFSLALADVQSVLSTNENHSKAIYRKTKALCGLGKYLEAQSFLTEKLNTAFCKKIKLENLEDLQKLVKHVDILVHQFKTGEFDIMELLEKQESKYLDVAEYTGDVAVMPIEGKGRGLIANKNFLPGDLIMANRAIEMVFADEKDDGIIGGLDVNLMDNCVVDESHTRLVAKLVQLLNDEPEHLSKLCNLYSGQNFTEVANSENNVDIKRLYYVCVYNCFKKGNRAIGLWNLPSFLNHSCMDYNARWYIIGDFIFIRALNFILKGEEIIITYFDLSKGIEEKNLFLKSLSFRCNCTLCQAENTIGMSAVKNAEKIEIEGLKYYNLQVRNAIQELEKTTSNNMLLNMVHYKLYTRLANIYMNAKDFKSALVVLKNLYDDVPYVFFMVKVFALCNLCYLAKIGFFSPDFPLEWCEKELKQNLSVLVGKSNVTKLISMYSYPEINENLRSLCFI